MYPETFFRPKNLSYLLIPCTGLDVLEDSYTDTTGIQNAEKANKMIHMFVCKSVFWLLYFIFWFLISLIDDFQTEAGIVLLLLQIYFNAVSEICYKEMLLLGYVFSESSSLGGN